ncbi:hypothetical protein F5Y07DRAFT_408768 [Xylaria sp. FL0933]|nr:hypothetical protein F5Y07DRAFT_408768 [Xylaria sp. FL0933]
MVPTKGKGKEPVVAIWPTSSNSHNALLAKSGHSPNISRSMLAQSQTSNNPSLVGNDPRSEKHSSNTWTSSSDNPDLPSDEEGKDDREWFILEYNRLAQRHGLRLLVPGDFSPPSGAKDSLKSRQSSWFSKMLRQASEQSEQTSMKPDKLINSHKRDALKSRDLKTLIRLCGRSPLFLPTDYAPCSLTLPTCFRALAQSLVQHADTKGIFRVPGSGRIINELYEYYCTDGDTDAISSTTRCPTLPTHIRCNTHDIASTFKRLLAGLPGGILGSLSLFDALVAIHTQLQGDAELHRTKESKLRARLIALAIGTVKSQYQRELICAVFGLLCLVGRIAENAPREDESGHPLPTTDLMGYSALGIVFGPLLIGELIDDYSMKVADPSAGLVLLPVSPPRSRKERHKHKHRHRHRHSKRHERNHAPAAPSSFSLDKIHIANSITEMLIIHWREVVRQLRNTGAVKPGHSVSNRQERQGSVQNSISSFIPRSHSLINPSHLDHAHSRSVSPATVSQASTSGMKPSSEQDHGLDLSTPHARPASRTSSSGSAHRHPTKAAPHPLSPTIEESSSPCIGASNLVQDYRNAKEIDVGDFGQNPNSIPLDPHASRDHDDNPVGGMSGHGNIGKEATIDAGSVIPHTAATGTRKSESPQSPSPTQQNGTLIMPYLDLVPVGADKAADAVSLKATSSPSTNTSPSIKGLDTPLTPRDEHRPAFPRLKASQETISYDYRMGTCPSDLNGAVKANSNTSPTRTAEKVPGKTPLHNRCHNGDHANRRLPQSTTAPNLGRAGNSVLTKWPNSGDVHSGNLSRNSPSYETLASPADQWRNIKLSSKASTESLAKLAKERRLKRSSGHVPSHQSRDASVLADSEPTAPERTRELIQNGCEPREKSTMERSERKDTMEEKSQPRLPFPDTCRKNYSSDKYSTNTSYGGRSQRSASKPMPGAVKAMAALFDSAVKESPDGSVVGLNGRTRHRLGESNGFSYRGALDESPTKPKPYRAQASLKPEVNLNEHPQHRKPAETSTPRRYIPTPRNGRSTVRTVPCRPMIEHTPSRASCSTLKPVKTFHSSRKEPQSSTSNPAHEIDRNQPPRLGTMIPHEEEPPVGHFVRPTSATSARSQNISGTEGAVPSALSSHHEPAAGSRQTSGNSFLHAQIRSLQRQLDLRNEEIAQLRRRLETQEHVDIGTLCEQLRFARREGLNWRKRAEAAERRVAVFQRFGAKVEGLKDGAFDDDDDEKYGDGGDEGDGGNTGDDSGTCVRGSSSRGERVGYGVEMGDDAEAYSSYSVHTESREAFNERIRRSFAGKMRNTTGGDGTVSREDYVEGTSDVGAGGEYQLRRDRAPRTDRLWEAAQEMFDMGHPYGMYISER